jgi:hypothetical protein
MLQTKPHILLSSRRSYHSHRSSQSCTRAKPWTQPIQVKSCTQVKACAQLKPRTQAKPCIQVKPCIQIKQERSWWMQVMPWIPARDSQWPDQLLSPTCPLSTAEPCFPPPAKKYPPFQTPRLGRDLTLFSSSLSDQIHLTPPVISSQSSPGVSTEGALQSHHCCHALVASKGPLLACQ